MECTALINSGAQISTITISFAQSLGSEIKKLQRLISVEGTGGGKVPYFEYVEVIMQIPDVTMYDEDCLMLVIDDSHYRRGVPIQVETLHIDQILDLMISEELDRLNKQ